MAGKHGARRRGARAQIPARLEPLGIIDGRTLVEPVMDTFAVEHRRYLALCGVLGLAASAVARGRGQLRLDRGRALS